MNRTITIHTLLSLLVLWSMYALGQPTAFNYEGQLFVNDSPATGIYDLRFSLFATPTNGVAVAGPLTFDEVNISRGEFSVRLDFGEGAFTGQNLWLEVLLATNRSTIFKVLQPRQLLSAAPFAVYALKANSSQYASALQGSVKIGQPSEGWAYHSQVGAERYLSALALPTGTALNWDPVQWASGKTNYSMSHGFVVNEAGELALITASTKSVSGTWTNPGVITTSRDTRLLVDKAGNIILGRTNVVVDMQGNVILDSSAKSNAFVRIKSNAKNRGQGGLRFDQDATNYFAVWSEGTGGESAGLVTGFGRGSLPPTNVVFRLSPQGASTRTLTITGGSDIAEPFPTSMDTAPTPGTLMTIDSQRSGQLKVCTTAYDTKVAGVVSGAGDIGPGLLLKKESSIASGDCPIALTGRVFCWADASAGGAINPGDILTSSGTAGHCMRANDLDKAKGAVIGKAMSTLVEGRGLVLVLVSLQ